MAGHPAGRPRLPHEPALVVVAVQAPVFDLYRDVPPDGLLYRPVDGRVPTASEHRQPGQAGYDRAAHRGFVLIHDYENTPGGCRCSVAPTSRLPGGPRSVRQPPAGRTAPDSHSLCQSKRHDWLHLARDLGRLRPLWGVQMSKISRHTTARGSAPTRHHVDASSPRDAASASLSARSESCGEPYATRTASAAVDRASASSPASARVLASSRSATTRLRMSSPGMPTACRAYPSASSVRPAQRSARA